MQIQKIISGGQTGVDRAALDAAIKLQIPCGGFCPKGRLAEDGMIPDFYPLIEHSSSSYPARTKRNIVESDATLVLKRETLTRGTSLTIKLCKELRKPCSVINMSIITEGELPLMVNGFKVWLLLHQIKTLNVAGPRESSTQGIYSQAYSLLLQLLPK